MSDQPSQRPESGQQPESPQPPGFEPPRFAAPSGSGTPTPPQYGQGGYGQNGLGQNASAQGGYGQNTYGEPGRYGTPYGQQPGPYAQNPGSYGQPASPYGQQAYYGMQAEPKTLSIASMVCGIASVIMGWILIPQVAAIITGHMALKREPAGRGMAIAGLVLGYLCLLGYGALWLLAIIGLTIASTTGGTGYTY
jgi:Domain of unknown function (DUF4190)